MTCSIKRNWILGGYTAEFAQQFPLTSVTLSRLAHELLGILRDTITAAGPSRPVELFNLKGREHADSVLAGPPHPVDGEVLSLGGSIATGSERGEFSWSPFRFSCVTHFKRFEGNNQIVHSPELHTTDSVPEWLPWWLLGAAAPLKIEYLRVGFENFSSRFSVARFGAVPVVSDTLLLDATQESLSVSLTTQQPRWQSSNPFEKLPLFKQVSLAIEKVCGLSPSESFFHQLSALARFP